MKINSNLAPDTIGPYSQAIKADKFIFVSGQIPVNKETGTMADNIVGQTHQSLKNIKYILEETGYTMNDIVKTTVLLQSMDDFAKMNEVYGSYFTKDYPARACYEVSKLPKGALVEIEAIAYKE